MDIICPRCSEPCDLYELHDTYDANLPSYAPAREFNDARKIFFDEKQGCGVLFNGTPCEIKQTEESIASSILSDLLGDDIDGIASMLDDFGYV